MAARTVDRRKQVRRAAAKLFDERGYQGTTMDDLAAKLGLNKATIYHHYSSKSVLLDAIYNEPCDALLAFIAEIPEDASPEASLTILVGCLLKLLDESPHEVAVYCQEMRWLHEWLPPRMHRKIRAKQDEFTQYVIDVVQRGMDEGRFKVSDPKIVAFGIIGMVSWAYQWYKPNGPQSADNVAATLTDLMVNGLRGDTDAVAEVEAPARATRSATKATPTKVTPTKATPTKTVPSSRRVGTRAG